MHFISDYGLFVLKLLSLVIAILLTLAGIIALIAKDKTKLPAKLTIQPLNKHFSHYAHSMLTALGDKAGLKSLKKKTDLSQRPKLFVLNFHGDIRASAVNALREEISAILLVAVPGDEVLLRLESAGGVVNGYGLAASQLSRLRNAKLKLTIVVDRIAASGGYMMAAVADRIVAAPFAIIGSIGVVTQLPNFHHFLKKKHIDFEQITAGEYKRTLSLFGENTEKGREKVQQEIDEMLELFKSHIQAFRPQVNLSQVATGEHWLAQQATRFGLIDDLGTSDDLLLAAYHTHQLHEVTYRIRKSLTERLFATASTWLGHAL